MQKAVADLFRQDRKIGLSVQVVAGVVGEYGGDAQRFAITQGQPAAQKRMMHVHDIHCLQQFLGSAVVTEGQIIAGVHQRQAGRADDARFVVMIILIAEGEDEDLMPRLFEIALVQLDVIRDPADVRLVDVCHHPDSHDYMVQARRCVCQDAYGRMKTSNPQD